MTWITVLLSVVGILLIPAIGLMIRGAMKWTRVESKLDHVVDSVREIVRDKDKVHSEMLSQMKEDRAATNRRLEYLERIWIERRIS